MPKFKKNKEIRELFDDAKLNKAVHLVVNNNVSVQQAAKTYGIDRRYWENNCLVRKQNSLKLVQFQSIARSHY